MQGHATGWYENPSISSGSVTLSHLSCGAMGNVSDATSLKKRIVLTTCSWDWQIRPCVSDYSTDLIFNLFLFIL